MYSGRVVYRTVTKLVDVAQELDPTQEIADAGRLMIKKKNRRTYHDIQASMSTGRS